MTRADDATRRNAMSALDDILKRSEFPAVRKCYQDFHAFGKQSVPWSAFDAIEELATKLAKSIEWGRIERKRKEKAETEREELRIMRDNDILSRDRTIEDLRRRAEQAKSRLDAEKVIAHSLQGAVEKAETEAARLNRCLKAGREEWLLATNELEVVTDQLAHEKEEHDKLKEEVARLKEGMRRICNELGVPDATYPANVANAYGIAHGDCEADLDTRVWRM